MSKLEKIDRELEKAREKAAEWQAKIKDLEKQRQEEENSMIHSMVHAANLTPEQLARIIELAAKGAVGIYTAQPDAPATFDKEEEHNED